MTPQDALCRAININPGVTSFEANYWVPIFHTRVGNSICRPVLSDGKVTVAGKSVHGCQAGNNLAVRVTRNGPPRLVVSRPLHIRLKLYFHHIHV